MARLFHTGFEAGSFSADAALFGINTISGFAPTWNTTGQRSGKSCIQLASQASTYCIATGLGTSLSNTYYTRMAVYLSSTPAVTRLFGLSDSSFNGLEVNFDGSGNMQMRNNNAGTIITTTPASFAISNGVWHVIEFSWVPNTGAVTVYVDGSSVMTGTSETATAASIQAYLWGSGPSSILLDDWALNDSTGGSCNSWCGLGQVVLQPAASDSSRTGFVAGGSGGGTTNLYAAVENLPPVGVVYASATSTSQISDATSNTTDNYVTNLETYTAAGVPSGASIVCQQAITSIGGSGTTSQTTGLTVVSNPSGGSEATGTTGATAAGTWPTNWTTLKTAMAYAPTVTLGTAPTLKIRKGTATTQASMSAFMGVLTEYLPGATPAAAGGFFLAA